MTSRFLLDCQAKYLKVAFTSQWSCLGGHALKVKSLLLSLCCGALLLRVPSIVAQSPNETIFNDLAKRTAVSASLDVHDDVSRRTAVYAEAYNLAKQAQTRQSSYVVNITDPEVLGTLGYRQDISNRIDEVYILSKDSVLDKGDIVLPLRNGTYVPQSYSLDAPSAASLLKYTPSATLPFTKKEPTVEKLMVRVIDGVLVQEWIAPSAQHASTRSADCADVTLEWLASAYMPGSETIINVPSDGNMRSSDLGGSVDCAPTCTNYLSKIDNTTLVWQNADCVYQDLWTVTK